jgi:hypothetical protein
MKGALFEDLVPITFEYRVFLPLLKTSRQVDLVEASKVVGKDQPALACEKLLFAMQEKLLLSLGLIKLAYPMIKVIICANNLIRMLL